MRASTGGGDDQGAVDRLDTCPLCRAQARDKANHVNAIAEGWWSMREWFMGGEADIEDEAT